MPGAQISQSLSKVMKRLKKYDLESQKNRQKRPDFWGGYSFKPYYFEFWKGNENRLNKREVYNFIENKWQISFLQP